MVKHGTHSCRRDGPQTILGRRRPGIWNRQKPRIWSRPEPEIWSHQKFRDRANGLRGKIDYAEGITHIFREHFGTVQYKKQQTTVDGLRKKWDTLACADPANVRRWMKERAEVRARAQVHRWMKKQAKAKAQTWTYALALASVEEQAQAEAKEQAKAQDPTIVDLCFGLQEMTVGK